MSGNGESHPAHPTTWLMYGRFEGLRFAKWLIYGTETRILQVQALQFRVPYSRYRDLDAIYKPLGIPRLPESATYKRVTRREPVQDSPEHASASRIRENQHAPVQPPRRACPHPQNQTESTHFCPIPRKVSQLSATPSPKQTKIAGPPNQRAGNRHRRRTTVATTSTAAPHSSVTAFAQLQHHIAAAATVATSIAAPHSSRKRCNNRKRDCSHSRNHRGHSVTQSAG